MSRPKQSSAERALDAMINVRDADLERMDTELLDLFAMLTLRYANQIDRQLRRRRREADQAKEGDHVATH
jgi:Skp family chaperone for outer membrane proteins